MKGEKNFYANVPFFLPNPTFLAFKVPKKKQTTFWTYQTIRQEKNATYKTVA